MASEQKPTVSYIANPATTVNPVATQPVNIKSVTVNSAFSEKSHVPPVTNPIAAGTANSTPVSNLLAKPVAGISATPATSSAAKTTPVPLSQKPMAAPIQDLLSAGTTSTTPVPNLPAKAVVAPNGILAAADQANIMRTPLPGKPIVKPITGPVTAGTANTTPASNLVGSHTAAPIASPGNAGAAKVTPIQGSRMANNAQVYQRTLPGTAPLPVPLTAAQLTPAQRAALLKNAGTTPYQTTGQNNLATFSRPQSLTSTTPGAKPMPLTGQVQMFSRAGVPQTVQHIQRPLPTQQQQNAIAHSGHIKTEIQANHGASTSRTDGQSKEIVDEAENERTRLENRERKKRWREANEDRNKDNDLRCRVNKRANKLFGKPQDPVKIREKELWIEEEFDKRKSKRQEKEGKGPDGNLLVEGTDLSSLNHYEMNNVIMTTLIEFAKNPAAPPLLQGNADLTAMLQRIRANPDSIRAMLVGTPGNAWQSINGVHNGVNGGSKTQHVSSEDDEEEDENMSNQDFVMTDAIDPPSFGETAAMKASTAANPAEFNQQTSALQRGASSNSNSNDSQGQNQHRTYGIGSGFEPPVAQALCSELFRLVCIQPAAQAKTSSAVPFKAATSPYLPPGHVQPVANKVETTMLKKEMESV